MGADGSRPAEMGAEELAEKQREILRMDQIVRNKVRSGVQYNMKVILRGERGSGKTSLWKRFQGLNLEESYQPTAEIQSATINWSFKNNEDHVKVEVWDVVDKAIKNKALSKADSSSSTSHGKHKIEYLDASVVDVYKDSHAVIFLLNPLATQSLAYVQEKLQEVPPHLSVLLLLNFKDLIPEKDFKLSLSRRKKEDSVAFDDVLQLCEALRMQRRKCRMEKKIDHDYASHHCDVYAFEASLLNCFGLQQLHRYLDIPFLQLKTKALRDQLRLAVGDLQEADKFLQDSIHQSDYADFEQKHEARKQKVIERDFAVLEAAGSTRAASEQSSADSSSDDSLPRRKHSKHKKTHNKKKEKEEKDELAVSLSAQRFPSEAQRSDKGGADNAALKLDHSDNHQQSSRTKKSSKGLHKGDDKGKDEGKLISMETGEERKKTQFDTEAYAFQPNTQNPTDSLEGFLEPSDEEEKRIYANKQKIKAYSKKTEKQKSESDDSEAEWSRRHQKVSASTPSSKPSPTVPHSSDSDDNYNRNPTQSNLAEKKTGAGKLVKRSKRKEEVVDIAAMQAASISPEAEMSKLRIPSSTSPIPSPPVISTNITTEVEVKPLPSKEAKKEIKKSAKTSSKTKVASSDEDLPAVMKYGSMATVEDSEDEESYRTAQVSKLSKPSKMKKVGKSSSSSIPKEIDL